MSNNEYMNNYMKNRWIKRRLTAIKELGGKCSNCGSEENLQFDHIDPKTKSETIAKFSSMNEKTFWKEVKKCQLLCKKCHQEKTFIDLNQTNAKENHGTLSSYRYCKCDLCKKAKSDYMKKYNENRKM